MLPYSQSWSSALIISLHNAMQVTTRCSQALPAWYPRFRLKRHSATARSWWRFISPSTALTAIWPWHCTEASCPCRSATSSKTRSKMWVCTYVLLAPALYRVDLGCWHDYTRTNDVPLSIRFKITPPYSALFRSISCVTYCRSCIMVEMLYNIQRQKSCIKYTYTCIT